MAVAALAAAAVLGLASPAVAHNSVVSTNPAEGAVVTELPESFEIRTSDSLLDLGGGYQSGTSNMRAITWGFIAAQHLAGGS